MQIDERTELAPALGELAANFTALVQVLLGNGQVQLTPQQIVDVAARIVPGCRHAAVVVIDQNQPQTLASTDEIPDHVNAVQFDVGEGPSWDVLVTDEYVRIDDLADDSRWPQFSSRAIEIADVRSMITYRLDLGRRCRAALSFCSTWPYAFDDTAAAIGAMFAAYCSLRSITQRLGDARSTLAALPRSTER